MQGKVKEQYGQSKLMASFCLLSADGAELFQAMKGS